MDCKKSVIFIDEFFKIEFENVRDNLVSVMRTDNCKVQKLS